MKELNPLEPIIDEISEFLEKIYQEGGSNVMKGNVTEEQYKEFHELERRMLAAREAFKIALKETEIDESDLRDRLQNTENLYPDDRRVVEKAQKMKRELKNLIHIVNRAEEKKRAVTSKTGRKMKKKKMKKGSMDLDIEQRRGWKKL